MTSQEDTAAVSGPTHTLRIEILGALRVRRDGDEVLLSTPKLRTLLAVLTLRSTKGASITELKEAVWGSRIPENADKALQTYVMRLRRLLGPDAIVTDGRGYRLDESVASDVEDFVNGLADANRAEADRDRVDCLANAVRLWRGDLADEAQAWIGAIADGHRLRELRDDAADELATAKLALGETSALIADLEVSVGENPLRERRWVLLIQALDSAGRSADALRAYQRARAVLIETVGIEPGPELRNAERTILERDPGFDSESGAATVRAEVDTLIALASAEFVAGNPTSRVSAIAAARLAERLDDTDRFLEAVLCATQQIDAALYATDSQWVALLRRAVQRELPETTRARALAMLAAELNAEFDSSERRALSDTALAYARSSNDRDTLHQVLAARVATIRAPDTLPERLRNTEEDLLLLGDDGDARHRWAALSNRALTCVEAGKFEEAARCDLQADAIAGSLGVAAMRWRSRVAITRELIRVGDFRAAVDRAHEAFGYGDDAYVHARTVLNGQLYWIRVKSGRGITFSDPPPNISGSQLERAFLCHALASAGHTESARRVLFGLAARRFGEIAFNGDYLVVMTLLAEVVTMLRERPLAREIIERLEPWNAQHASSVATYIAPVEATINALAETG
ncbi:MAG TPA: BTAD domain-containing putative transcriptional regulator [Acidimicrobiia bacterium]|nr:BTAD domain-containing putative transcriptional regulator [Acidimicrobiia bacterium]